MREKELLHHEGPKKNGTWILNEVIVKSLKYPLDTLLYIWYHIPVTKQKPPASHLAVYTRQGWI